MSIFDQNHLEVGDNQDPDYLLQRAQLAVLQGKYNDASALLQRGLQMIAEAETSYEHEAEMRSEFAKALFSMKRRDEAIAQMKRAAELFKHRGNQQYLHDAYNRLTEFNLFEPAVAEYYAEQALNLGRQLKNSEALASDLDYLGQAKIALGRYQEAIQSLQEANQLVDNFDLKFTLAQALVKAGQPLEGIEIYKTLLEWAKTKENVQSKIYILLGLAEAKRSLLEEEEALSLLRQAHQLARTISSDELSLKAAERLSLALLEANHLEEAAQVLEQGVEEARKLGLVQEELNLLFQLGQTLNEMRDLEGAEKTLLRVLSESRVHAYGKAERLALSTLGNVAANQNQFNRALSIYQEAANLSHETGDSDVEAACLDSAGLMYTQLSRPGRAIEYHQQASQLHAELKQWDHQISDLLNLSQAYMALHEVELATKLLQDIQELAAQYELALPWQFFLNTGRLAWEQQNWHQARQHFRNGILAIESIRHSLKTPQQQRQWARDKADAYSLAAEAAICAGDGASAIEFIECNKTRFLQAIIQRRSQRPPNVSESTWLKYEQAAKRRSELQARRRSGLAYADPDLDQEIEIAKKDYNQALATFQASAQETFDQLPEFTFPDWKNLALAIPPAYVAVSIAIYQTGLGIVCVCRDTSGKPFALAKMANTFTEADMDRLIFGDREVLSAARETGNFAQIPPESLGWVLSWAFPNATDDLWQQTISHVCRVLGEHIWPVILDLLPENTKNLILMPSVGFNVLPLDAAQLPNGLRVNEQFSITYAPSLGVLEQIQKHNPISVVVSLGQVVNPTVDKPLLYSRVEAKQVRHSFDPSIRVQQLIGEKATVEPVLAMLKDCDIFHFSGHAFYDELEPFRSGLLCAPKKSILSLGTILDQIISIKSKFIVLSACETGQVQADDVLNDFLGLPGGFILAGANAVLATFWRVDDLATCLLLEKFFELWQTDKLTLPEALAEAQKWLRTEVTINLVFEKLEAWLEESMGSGEEYELLQSLNDEWDFRYNDQDRNIYLFQDEIYWAAFYITGFND